MLNILSASQCGFLFFDPYKFVNVCFCSEQETDRTTYSSDIDDRTLHEIYAHPFLKSVMAGVGSIMCSYSTLSYCFSRYDSLFPYLHTLDLLNGTYACENDKLMNDIMKREFGFQGCNYLYPLKNYVLTFSTV